MGSRSSLALTATSSSRPTCKRIRCRQAPPPQRPDVRTRAPALRRARRRQPSPPLVVVIVVVEHRAAYFRSSLASHSSPPQPPCCGVHHHCFGARCLRRIFYRTVLRRFSSSSRCQTVQWQHVLANGAGWRSVVVRSAVVPAVVGLIEQVYFLQVK